MTQLSAARDLRIFPANYMPWNIYYLCNYTIHMWFNQLLIVQLSNKLSLGGKLFDITRCKYINIILGELIKKVPVLDCHIRTLPLYPFNFYVIGARGQYKYSFKECDIIQERIRGNDTIDTYVLCIYSRLRNAQFTDVNFVDAPVHINL